MKRVVHLFALLTGLWGPSAFADEVLEPLVLQLRWITQAQFAGYYVALDRGIYRRHGLDVTILPGGPNLNPHEALMNGSTDVSIEWLPHALTQRERGVPMVNIAQIFHQSGYTLSCRKDHGIRELRDLDGKRIGSWFVGDEEKVRALLRREGVAATLEDGLYVLESLLGDEGMRERLARFVAATLEGWHYTLDHPQEALEIVLANDPTGALDEDHQRRMLEVITSLLHRDRNQIGLLLQQQYNQTLQHMLDRGMIEHPIDDGYTQQIWKAARARLER